MYAADIIELPMRRDADAASQPLRRAAEPPPRAPSAAERRASDAPRHEPMSAARR